MLTIKITGFTSAEQIDTAYQAIYKTYGQEELAVQSEDDTTITIIYDDDNDCDLQAQEVADLCSLDVSRVTTEFVPYNTLNQRMNEAAQAHTYFDGTTYYEIDNCYEDEDDNGNPCFRVLDPRTSEDYLIAFCDIPAEAYFMKLVRIG